MAAKVSSEHHQTQISCFLGLLEDRGGSDCRDEVEALTSLFSAGAATSSRFTNVALDDMESRSTVECRPWDLRRFPTHSHKYSSIFFSPFSFPFE